MVARAGAGRGGGGVGGRRRAGRTGQLHDGGDDAWVGVDAGSAAAHQVGADDLYTTWRPNSQIQHNRSHLINKQAIQIKIKLFEYLINSFNTQEVKFGTYKKKSS